MSEVDPVHGARNLADLVRAAALASPEHPALLVDERVISWRELDAAVSSFASGLLRHGLATGDRIALTLTNGAPFVVSYFGALRAGLVVMPLNTGYTAAELTGIFEQAAPALVVAGAASAAAARTAIGAQVPVVVVGEASYDSILAAGSRADAPAPPDPATFDPESLAVLLFSSALSGHAKGAMLTHRALLANIGQLLRIKPPAMRADDVVLVVLPLFHVYALNAVLGIAAAAGATCVLTEEFHPQRTLDLVERHRVTYLPGAPPMYVAWSQRTDLRERLSTVRTVVSGAAPLSPGVLALVSERLGRPVWEGYGVTEAAPVIATTFCTGRSTPGCVGQPVPGMEVRLIDDDGGPADDGDPGEVELRGPNLFSGYWPDGSGGPDAQGWWRTGDIAYLNQDDDLHIVDRRRDVVLVSGFSVYPFEVETALASHPDVAEAAVIGVPDERTGSAVKAFVVALAGHQIDSGQLLEHASSRLARFKRPTQIQVVPELPHSSTGKINRDRLRAGAFGD